MTEKKLKFEVRWLMRKLRFRYLLEDSQNRNDTIHGDYRIWQ